MNAAQWVAQIMVGSLGTILAVIAIAMTGFAMLRGHVPVSKGVRIVLGCFVLFGAPVIARSLVALGGGPGLQQTIAAAGRHARSAPSAHTAV